MHRLSNGTQVTAMPVPAAVSGTPGFATGGSPGNQAASVIDPDAFNTLQEELMAWLDAVGALPDKTNNGQTLAAARTLFMASGYSSTGTSPDSGDSTGIIWVKVGTMCRLLWQETNVYDSKTINLPFNFSPGYFFGSQTGAPAGWASWVNGTVGHNTVTLHVGKQSGGTSGVAASGDGFSASMMVEGVLAT